MLIKLRSVVDMILGEGAKKVVGLRVCDPSFL